MKTSRSTKSYPIWRFRTQKQSKRSSKIISKSSLPHSKIWGRQQCQSLTASNWCPTIISIRSQGQCHHVIMKLLRKRSIVCYRPVSSPLLSRHGRHRYKLPRRRMDHHVSVLTIASWTPLCMRIVSRYLELMKNSMICEETQYSLK